MRERTRESFVHPNEVQGKSLYNPALDKASCGVGFVTHIKGEKSREIVTLALESLCRLEHRGAVGADPNTGDGSGITLQISDPFFQTVAETLKFKLPQAGKYGIGFLYLPQNRSIRQGIEILIEKVALDEGLHFLGWRDVPVQLDAIGDAALKTAPYMRQCFIGATNDIKGTLDFDRKLYLIRRIIDRRIRAEYKLDRSQYYVASFSSRTIVYKGMLTAQQLIDYYPDLSNEKMISALALIHQRYSTNTFPTWDLAQPFRMIAHNGEINTIRGNQNWMAARQMTMQSPIYGKNLRRMLPIIMEGQSDSATFDTVFELLHMTGRSLPHTMMMMIPEAWSKNKNMPASLRDFYEYHATIMEPWDGPAAIAFTDGEQIGATLDRNGLRPGRYVITKDDLVIMASEGGTVDIKPERILSSDRLRPGHMFLVDIKSGNIIHNSEIKEQITSFQPYGKWVHQNILRLDNLPDLTFISQSNHETIRETQRIFGYTTEDLNLHLRPMAIHAQEPIGSMGVDSSLAVLSKKEMPLFYYFKQQFAQVTNPAIDPIREELVMDLIGYIGSEGNLLMEEEPKHFMRMELEQPILTTKDLEKIRHISNDNFQTKTINILFDPNINHGMRNRLDQIQDEAAEVIRNGCNLIILSDRGASINKTPIPSLLAVSGVHHSLIKAGLRTQASILVESGEPREVFHFALLLGYGANAISPYLAFESLTNMIKEGQLSEVKSLQIAHDNYIKSIGKGLLKIFSKMGISTLQSYCGAQMFEAIGLDSELISLYFCGTQSHIEGLSLEMIEEECLRRHQAAYNPLEIQKQLPTGGVHHYRKYGIKHLLNPRTVHLLQHACRTENYDLYKEYSQSVNKQEESPITLRNLFKLLLAPKTALKLSEVESAESIFKRFSTGAMSFGSISWEAHTDLAIAMNKIGGKSNTGEGGEDKIRFLPIKDGRSMRSAIKQIASGRFGVTTNYLVNADDIQIKISQGAKPGEGGQLPGHKVDEYIAKLRFSTPGVTLISPPPHHDIYSIEDIKQLIFDLKNVNPRARISVKLVSETGIGTVAAGVAKAHADHILISGYSGGTGASPISSIHHAGTPWELGLSETHQTLLIQGLRDRVYLAVDGKILTGKDVVIAALLGAEEFGFSIAPLISLGCIMMRKCHLNTCPVGIATQNVELRKRYTGSPEHVVTYMRFIVQEVREYMAAMGFQRFEDMIGKIDRIKVAFPKTHWKARGLDFSRLLYVAPAAYNTKLFRSREQKHAIDSQIDKDFIKQASPLLKSPISNQQTKQKILIKANISNQDRSIGTMLSGEVTRIYQEKGLPKSSIRIEMVGIAGQSFGAFLCQGIDLHLSGQANDYVGKGMSGGQLVISIPELADYVSWKNIIIGNTCLYGATAGEAYFEGLAGERFCVRNSGVHTVVEGVGDHGCEYMTGGRVVILGKVGRNFAAGMSGGIAYVYDTENALKENLNTTLVQQEQLVSEENINECINLIKKHHHFTKSKRSKLILDNWEEERRKFAIIISPEYKKVVAQKKTF